MNIGNVAAKTFMIVAFVFFSTLCFSTKSEEIDCKNDISKILNTIKFFETENLSENGKIIFHKIEIKLKDRLGRGVSVNCVKSLLDEIGEENYLRINNGFSIGGQNPNFRFGIFISEEGNISDVFVMK